MILVTVLVHSLTLKPLAKRLGLLAGVKNGLLIVGGSEWAASLAAKLRENNVEALVADNAYEKLHAVEWTPCPPTLARCWRTASRTTSTSPD